MPPTPIKDIGGQRFGMLVAIERMLGRQSGKVAWRCRCDCGNTVVYLGAFLRSGKFRSCGCVPYRQVKDPT